LESRHSRLGNRYWTDCIDSRAQGQPRTTYADRCSEHRELSRRTDRLSLRAFGRQEVQSPKLTESRREISDCLYSTPRGSNGEGSLCPPARKQHRDCSTCRSPANRSAFV